VVGQPDFVSNAAPDTPSAQNLSSPVDVASDGKRLFVVDEGNLRVLVYNPFPTSNQPAASVVLGQADFVSNVQNAPSGTESDQGFSACRSLRGSSTWPISAMGASWCSRTCSSDRRRLTSFQPARWSACQNISLAKVAWRVDRPGLGCSVIKSEETSAPP
jgi:hypothetical protein